MRTSSCCWVGTRGCDAVRSSRSSGATSISGSGSSALNGPTGEGTSPVPKGGRLRYVSLTVRLAAALRDHRHLRAPRVVCQRDGAPLTNNMVAESVRRAVRRAGLTVSGVHRLRHTFCSHLAMRGVPARAIQELAGHQDLTTTQRYMHLSPAAIENAMRLLDLPKIGRDRGEILETGGSENLKSLR